MPLRGGGLGRGSLRELCLVVEVNLRLGCCTGLERDSEQGERNNVQDVRDDSRARWVSSCDYHHLWFFVCVMVVGLRSLNS